MTNHLLYIIDRMKNVWAKYNIYTYIECIVYTMLNPRIVIETDKNVQTRRLQTLIIIKSLMKWGFFLTKSHHFIS